MRGVCGSTLLFTQSGPKSIKNINNDIITCLINKQCAQCIAKASSSGTIKDRMIKLHFKDGSNITCTQSTEFLMETGDYKKACDIVYNEAFYTMTDRLMRLASFEFCHEKYDVYTMLIEDSRAFDVELFNHVFVRIGC